MSVGERPGVEMGHEAHRTEEKIGSERLNSLAENPVGSWDPHLELQTVLSHSK